MESFERLLLAAVERDQFGLAFWLFSKNRDARLLERTVEISLERASHLQKKKAKDAQDRANLAAYKTALLSGLKSAPVDSKKPRPQVVLVVCLTFPCVQIT